MITARDARLVYENAKNAIASIKNPQTGLPMYSLADAKLTQSYLRSDVFLSTTLASYRFPIKTNDVFNGQAQMADEQRLQLQDMFIVSSVALRIAIAANGTNSFRTFTFPDASVFTTGATSLYTLYNGKLAVTINNNTIVPAWDVLKHLDIPIQQAVANAYFTASGQVLLSSDEASNQGFYPCEPNWILSGGANIDVELNLPSAPGTLDASTRAILMLRGVLAQNVTTVK